MSDAAELRRRSPPPSAPTLIRRQFSPIAAICGRDSWPRKCARTPCAVGQPSPRATATRPSSVIVGEHARGRRRGWPPRRTRPCSLQPADLPGHPARQRHQLLGEIPHPRRAGRGLVQHVEQPHVVERQLMRVDQARFSVAYIRSAESRKFCHDLCSAMSSPGISLAVRPAIIPSMVAMVEQASVAQADRH